MNDINNNIIKCIDEEKSRLVRDFLQTQHIRNTVNGNRDNLSNI